MKTTGLDMLIPAFLATAFIATSISTAGQAATLKLTAMLGDNAVIQRGIPVPIWGEGKPGARIVVSLSGKVVYARVKEDGSWRLAIGPYEAGELGDLTVTMGKESITSRNLAAGEVWFCAGQSNMAMAVSGSTGWETEKYDCNDKYLRLMVIPGDVSSAPLENTEALWKVSAESSVNSFSAVGYYFGKALRKELDVPVGIIQSAWNGTTAEVWTPLKELKSKKEFKPILDRWKKRVAKEPRIAAKESLFKLEVSAVSLVPSDGSAPVPLNVAGSATAGVWEELTKASNSRAVFNVAGNELFFAGKLGVAGYASVNRPMGTYEKPEDYSRFNAIRMRVRGRGVLNISVRTTDVWDWAFHISAPFKPTSQWKEVTLKFADFTQPDWGWKKPLNPALVWGFGLSADTGMPLPEMPAGLFNGMVAPAIPHAIRGILWYQGESNTDRAEQYRKLLPALINGWRREWGMGNLPFYIVQLANYDKEFEGAQENGWSEVREAQALALSLSNTGLATAIDIGEADNIHPKNKPELARRLSLVALANVYGKAVEFSGPVYASSKVESGKITVNLAHSAGLKARGGGPLKGFALAGADSVFHSAKAQITGNAIVVESPGVPDPVAVRYSWAINPTGNLVNASGLPALPFRTDDWKLSTAGKR